MPRRRLSLASDRFRIGCAAIVMSVAITDVRAEPGSSPLSVDRPESQWSVTSADDVSNAIDRVSTEANADANVDVDAERPFRFQFTGSSWPDVLAWLSDNADVSVRASTLPEGRVFYQDLHRRYTVNETIAILRDLLAAEGFAMTRDGRAVTIHDLSQPQAVRALIAASAMVDPTDLPSLDSNRHVRCRFDVSAWRGYEGFSMDAVRQAVEPSLSPVGQFTAVNVTEEIIVTDRVANLRRVDEIIDRAGDSFGSYPVRYRSATHLTTLVRHVMDHPRINFDAPPRITFSASPDGGRIFLTGDASEIRRATEILRSLDVPAERPYLRVYRGQSDRWRGWVAQTRTMWQRRDGRRGAIIVVDDRQRLTASRGDGNGGRNEPPEASEIFQSGDAVRVSFDGDRTIVASKSEKLLGEFAELLTIVRSSGDGAGERAMTIELAHVRPSQVVEPLRQWLGLESAESETAVPGAGAAGSGAPVGYSGPGEQFADDGDPNGEGSYDGSSASDDLPSIPPVTLMEHRTDPPEFVAVDATDTLFVRADPALHEDIRRFVERLDVPAAPLSLRATTSKPKPERLVEVVRVSPAVLAGGGLDSIIQMFGDQKSRQRADAKRTRQSDPSSGDAESASNDNSYDAMDDDVGDSAEPDAGARRPGRPDGRDTPRSAEPASAVPSGPGRDPHSAVNAGPGTAYGPAAGPAGYLYPPTGFRPPNYRGAIAPGVVPPGRYQGRVPLPNRSAPGRPGYPAVPNGYVDPSSGGVGRTPAGYRGR